MQIRGPPREPDPECRAGSTRRETTAAWQEIRAERMSLLDAGAQESAQIFKSRQCWAHLDDVDERPVRQTASSAPAAGPQTAEARRAISRPAPQDKAAANLTTGALDCPATSRWLGIAGASRQGCGRPARASLPLDGVWPLRADRPAALGEAMRLENCRPPRASPPSSRRLRGAPSRLAFLRLASARQARHSHRLHLAAAKSALNLGARLECLDVIN